MPVAQYICLAHLITEESTVFTIAKYFIESNVTSCM